MNQLEQARRQLVLEADLQRTLLRLEYVGLRNQLSWMSTLREAAPISRPLAIAGAVLAGIMAVRRARSLVRWLPTVLRALLWMRRQIK